MDLVFLTLTDIPADSNYSLRGYTNLYSYEQPMNYIPTNKESRVLLHPPHVDQVFQQLLSRHTLSKYIGE